MQKLSRALTIIAVFFLIRLTFSCCNCTEQIAYYQFDYMSISSINNSEWSAQHTDYDVMYDEAIAFEMTIMDSSSTFINIAQNWRPRLNSALAMQPCECPWHFFIKDEISRFSIISLRDFSLDKPAGTDVTDSFVFQTGWNHLYHQIDSLVPRLNLDYTTYSQPKKAIDLFSKDRVENDSLQLVFQLHFVNGEILADTTNVIAILTSGEEGRL